MITTNDPNATEDNTQAPCAQIWLENVNDRCDEYSIHAFFQTAEEDAAREIKVGHIMLSRFYRHSDPEIWFFMDPKFSDIDDGIDLTLLEKIIKEIRAFLSKHHGNTRFRTRIKGL